MGGVDGALDARLFVLRDSLFQNFVCNYISKFKQGIHVKQKCHRHAPKIKKDASVEGLEIQVKKSALSGKA
jgi:hypothetical protein